MDIERLKKTLHGLKKWGSQNQGSKAVILNLNTQAMSYELEGVIKEIKETQSFDSGFQKREFVVETPGEYPQSIKLEFTKDKCSILDNYGVGQSVRVKFNLRGNEYNGKHFVNLQAWQIEADPIQSKPSESKTPEQSPPAPTNEDDLPF